MKVSESVFIPKTSSSLNTITSQAWSSGCNFTFWRQSHCILWISALVVMDLHESVAHEQTLPVQYSFLYVCHESIYIWNFSVYIAWVMTPQTFCSQDVIFIESLYDSPWLTRVPSKQATELAYITSLSSEQRSQRFQVLRQMIVFGWSCVPCVEATALVTVCDSNQAEPPTSTRATHKPGSKDASPALEPARESVAAFFIRWTFCRESATAVSVSLETFSSAGVRPPTWARMPKMVIQ